MGLFSPFVWGQASMQTLPGPRTREAETTSYVADYLTRSVRRASGFVLADYPLDRAIHHEAGQGTLAQMPTLQSSKCSWVSNHSTSSRRHLSRSTSIVIPITMSNASRLRGFNRMVLLIKLVDIVPPV